MRIIWNKNKPFFRLAILFHVLYSKTDFGVAISFIYFHVDTCWLQHPETQPTIQNKSKALHKKILRICKKKKKGQSFHSTNSN